MATSTRKGLPVHDPQVLTIVDEQVSLKPTGLAGTDNIIVGFEEKYKPTGLKQDEIDLLKKVLQRLFSGSGVYFGNRYPNPPCSKKEKDLVLKSLKHRFVKLRAVVQAERQKDSLYFRQSLKHLFDLKGYIDWFEKAPCKEGDERFKGPLRELNDDDIKKLLKQFIFLILQGQYPLKNYESVDPNPAAFVGRLKEGALGDFNAFLQEYRSKNYPIPERISKVLEVADLDLNALRESIQNAIIAKLKEIIDTMRSSLEDPQNPLCQGIDLSVITAETIIKVFDCLVDKVKSLQDDLKRLTDELNTTKQALAEYESKTQGKDDEVALLKARITAFEAQVADLNAQIAKHEGAEKELQESLDHANNRISHLKTIIERLNAEKTQLDEMYRGLLAKLEEQTDEIRRLREVIEVLTAEKDALEKTKETNDEAQQRMRNLQELQDEFGKATARVVELEREKETLQTENRDKQQQIDELQAQLNTLNQRITTLEADKAKLISDAELDDFAINAQDSMIQTLKDERKEIIVRIKRLQQDHTEALAGKDLAIQELTNRLNAIQNERDGLLQDLDNLRNEMANQSEISKETVGQLQSIIERLTKEKAQLAKDIESLQTSSSEQKDYSDETIAQLQSVVQRLTSEQQALIDNLKKLEESSNQDKEESTATISQLKSIIQGLTSDKGGLSGRIQELTEELAQKTRELEQLRASSTQNQANRTKREADLEGKAVALQGDKEYLNQKIKEIMARLVAEKKRADDLQTQMTNEVNRLKKALADNNILLEDTNKANKAALDVLDDDYKEKMATLQKQLASLTNERSGLARKVNELQSKIAALEGSKETDNTELSNLRQEKTDLLKKLAEKDATLNGEIQRLQALLDGKQRELDMLQQRYTVLEAQGKQKQGELQNEVATLRNQLGEEGTELTDLKQRLAQAEADLQACNEARRVLEQRATTAEASAAKLAELQSTLESLQQQLSNAQAEIQRLTQEKQDLQVAHDAELKKLKEDHEKEIQALEKQVIESGDEQVRALNQQHQDNIRRLNEEHQTQLSDMQARHEAENTTLQQQLQTANDDCEERLRQATESANQQIADAQRALANMVAERDALQAEQARKDKMITTLEEEKEELADQVASRDLLSQQKDAEIEALKLENESKLAKAQAEIDRQASNIRQRNATIEELQRAQEGLVSLKSIDDLTKTIAGWLEAGAKEEGKPEIPDAFRDTTKFKDIVDNVMNLVAQATPDTPSSPGKEAKAEMVREAYTCYLILFASYLWGRHFPNKVEDRSTQDDKMLIVNHMPEILETGRGGQSGLYDLLERGDTGLNLEGQDPRMFTLKTVTKVMLMMEEIHALGKRDKSYTIPNLTENEVKLLQVLASVGTNILKNVGTNVTDFNRRLHFLTIRRGGPVDKDLTSVFIDFVNNSPIITYLGNDEASEKLKLKKILNFPFLFYVFLFVFKDYLNTLDKEEQCPLPNILKKN